VRDVIQKSNTAALDTLKNDSEAQKMNGKSKINICYPKQAKYLLGTTKKRNKKGETQGKWCPPPTTKARKEEEENLYTNVQRKI
jgi:hypothetical protein